MDEKAIPEQKAAKALENLLDRTYSGKDVTRLLFDELKRIGSGTLNGAYEEAILAEARKIVKHPWFDKAYKHSTKLIEFKKLALNK